MFLFGRLQKQKYRPAIRFPWLSPIPSSSPSISLSLAIIYAPDGAISGGAVRAMPPRRPKTLPRRETTNARAWRHDQNTGAKSEHQHNLLHLPLDYRRKTMYNNTAKYGVIPLCMVASHPMQATGALERFCGCSHLLFPCLSFYSI